MINPNPVKTLPFENISFLFFSLSSPQRKTAVKIFNDTTGNNIFTVVLIQSETPNAEADNILVYIGTIKKDISNVAPFPIAKINVSPASFLKRCFI